MPTPTLLTRLATVAILALPFSLKNAEAAPSTSGRIGATHSSLQRSVGASLDQLAMRFEPNVGQAGAGASFIARGTHYEVALALHEAKIWFSTAPHHAASVKMTFLGATGAARPVGQHRLSGITNYYAGNKAQNWRTGIRSYAQVQVSQVYRGIDLLYHGNSQHLEYDFVLAPKAQAAQIRIKFAGVKHLSLDSHGNLLLQLAKGIIKQQAPLVYQAGPQGRQRVAGHFALYAHNVVGFQLGRYDHARSVTIDPTIVLYGTFLGGSNFLANSTFESGYSVTTDNQGNIYLDGVASFAPANVNIRVQNFNVFNEEVFVAKLTPNNQGTVDLAYLTFIKGNFADTFLSDGIGFGYSLALDSVGNAYMVGTTRSGSLPVTTGAIQSSFNQGGATSANAADAFLATFTTTGALHYLTYLGGSDFDTGTAVTVDASGNVYVTGTTTLATCCGIHKLFPGLLSLPADNSAHIFVTKIVPNAALTVAQQQPFTTALFGNSDDDSSAIALDHAGNVLVAGYTLSTNLPGTAGGFRATNPSGGTVYTGFVAKLSPTLASPPIAATYLGGTSPFRDTKLFGLGVDTANNVDVAGYTYDSTYPTSSGNAYKSSFGSNHEVGIVTQLNPTLSTLRYSTFYDVATDTSTTYLDIYALAVDNMGTIYVTGKANGAVPTAGSPLTTSAFTGGAFLAEFIPDTTVPGNQQLAFSSLISGGSGDFGYGVAVDGNGFVYLAGQYISADGLLPVTTNPYQKVYNSTQSNAIALKLLPQPAPAPRCTVIATEITTAWRLGVAGGVKTPGSPPFPTSYITFRLGANNFVVRTPTLTCLRPGLGTAVAIFTGPIDSAKGTIFHHGDPVTVTFTSNPSLLPGGSPMTIEVSDPSATPAYDSVATAPLLFGSKLVYTPN